MYDVFDTVFASVCHQEVIEDPEGVKRLGHHALYLGSHVDRLFSLVSHQKRWWWDHCGHKCFNIWFNMYPISKSFRLTWNYVVQFILRSRYQHIYEVVEPRGRFSRCLLLGVVMVQAEVDESGAGWTWKLQQFELRSTDRYPYVYWVHVVN